MRPQSVHAANELLRRIRVLEYPAVMAGSTDPEALTHVHREACTREEAAELVSRLNAAHPPAWSWDGKIRWAGKRGRVRYRPRTQQCFLTLPSDQSLRVGVVLHEWAHMTLAHGFAHGRHFIEVLDYLTARWMSGAFGTWEQVIEAAASAPPAPKWAKRRPCVGCKVQTTRMRNGRTICARCESVL